MAREPINAAESPGQDAGFQFSLRGLLAFVTLLAIVIGLAFQAPNALVLGVVPPLLIAVPVGCVWWAFRDGKQGYYRACAFGAAFWSGLLLAWCAGSTWESFVSWVRGDWVTHEPFEDLAGVYAVKEVPAVHVLRLAAAMCRGALLLLFLAISVGAMTGAGMLWLQRRADEVQKKAE